MTDLHNIVPPISTFKEIGINKGLAKIGDAVVNLAYSQAKSIVSQRLSARNVNRTILCNALKNAGMKKYALTRADGHEMADTAEAFIGYMYCCEGWKIEQIVEILVENLSGKNLEEKNDENFAASQAFTQLLLKIKETLQNKLIS